MGKILKAGKKYTFSDYFELNNPTREIIEEFGYKYNFEELVLPKTSKAINHLDRLRQTYIKKLPLISLTSETAKRQFYISPLLLELLEYIRAEINVEYPLDAGENLSGNIDYLLKFTNNFIIIEAKKGDLEKGFNQLAVELIALDRVIETKQETLYGAVTLGDVWIFGALERQSKLLKKDMNAYTILSDLENLILILIGILEM
ncbi:MAG: hypothetical protein DRR19_30280 [Candidatus Parabeggiatoa sp. nov. 1]|nr:MAG: hypothetical protein DRR19_30280 [Gammaproteobacteria bacterium]